MALGDVRPVGTRPSDSSFRSGGLQPYEGYVPERGATGSAELQLIQGLNMALTDQNAVLQQIRDESKKMAMGIQAGMRMSAQGTAAGAAAALPPAMFDPSQQGMNPVVQAVTATQKIEESRARAFNIAPPSEGGGQSTAEILGRSGVGAPMDSPLSNNLTLAGQMSQPDSMRGKVAQSIAERLSRTEWGPSLGFNEGAMRWTDGDGRFVSNDAGQSFMRRQTVLRGTQDFMGGVAEGESAMGAVQGSLAKAGAREAARNGGRIGAFGTAAKAIGVAGAVYTAGQVANNFIMGQQAQNRTVMRDVGGGTMDALGERVDERMFKFKQSFVGGIGGAAAEELYRGSRQIFGTDQGARAGAEDFGVAMHKIGMDISESLELVKTAAESGNESLRGLRDGIKSVSETARASGISTAEGQQRFGAQYAAQAQTTSGQTAVDLATFETNAILGMGRGFNDVTLGTAASSSALRQQASLQGMNYNEFLTKRQQDTVFAAQAEETYINQRNPIAQNERARSHVRRRVQEIQRDNGKVTNSDWQVISGEVQNMGIVDAGALASILNSSVTTGLTERNAYEFAVRGLVDEVGGSAEGTLNLGGQAQERESALADTEANTKVSDELRSFGRNTSSNASIGTATGPGNQEYIALIEAIGGDPTRNYKAQSGSEKGRYLSSIIDGGGKRNPIIERMLKAGGFGKDTRYLVQTGDGEKEVTFGELVSDYSDQARTAEVIRGADDIVGQRVADVFQVEAGEAGKSATADAKSGWEKGRNDDTIYDEEGSNRSGTNGTVTIDLTEEARRVIRVTGTTGSARTGGPNDASAPEDR